MQVEFTFADQRFVVSLFATPAAREFLCMLPLDLEIEDYSTNEKVAYLATKLTLRPLESFKNEQPGDFCYFAPWGNLVFYTGPYRYSTGLIRLGRLTGDCQPLMTRGCHSLRAEVLTEPMTHR